MNRHHYGLILAGGRGTRFWPRSRKRSAKQVLNVVGERSLIQATVDRLAPIIAPERLWVLTNDHLRDIVIEQLPEIPKRPIPADPLPVRRFHEKPVLAKARRYVKAGNFFWNSGMFFWKTGVLLDKLRKHLPRTATVLASLPDFGSRRFAGSLAEAFPLCDNISIDFAVMEKAKDVHGIAAADFGWNDVGSWNAVYELLDRDEHGNSIALESIVLDSHNNFVDARGKLVALVGVSDLIVVDTPDALLVASRDRAHQGG